MFQELALPVLEKTHLKYYVHAKHSTALLTPQGHLVPLLTIDVKDVLFETILDAHEAAATYYDSHNKPYPYISEWGQSLLSMMQGAVHHTKTNVSSDLEQETMEF